MDDFTYKWKLSDLNKVRKNGLKVFSTFACGGGSTMGYKMAGYEVIGCNEIDPKMMQAYKLNHNPKYAFLEDIRMFKKRDDLPSEFFDLDILDGSPPCSSFSSAGLREKGWNKEKIFREGQSKQRLDDLFFHFIELANKLQPKIVVAENVKGMITGNAKGYVKQIINLLNTAGYDVQLFLLNAVTMGIPQRRERVFFIGKRRDLNFPKLHLNFNEKPIPLKEAFKDVKTKGKDRSGSKNFVYWEKCKSGKSFSSVHPRGSLFGSKKLSPHLPSNTIPGHWECLYHWESMRSLSDEELCLAGSYPLDYRTPNGIKLGYMVGMSVPPLMIYKISREIYKQLFAKQSNAQKTDS